MNSFGYNLRLTTFGESHGPAIGGVLDGFPSGVKLNFNKIIEELDKRKPGSSILVSQRNEPDKVEFLSGISEEGITLGTPIAFIIRNMDARGKDYSEISDKYRPNHADFTYEAKYGIREYKGGGRSSARETANWVVAGALAYQILEKSGIEILSFLSGVGKKSFTEEITSTLCKHPFVSLDSLIDESKRLNMEEEISKAFKDGDSVGGTVSCIITGLPAGLGDPIFLKFHARLAQAMMSINAAKGFEYGIGMNASSAHGSEILDSFKVGNGKIITESNFSGGIQGGISNGMPVFFNVSFKPTPTIMKEVKTINKNLEETFLKMKGRHDPCVALRAVPVVKAMASLVIADCIL